MAVMVDDLTLNGVSEPYRMLTARAEYRLRLRANNASTRLTPLAIEAGCVGEARRTWFTEREQRRALWGASMGREVAAPDLAAAGLTVRRDLGRQAIADWFRFDLSAHQLAPWIGNDFDAESELAAELVEDARYAPYVERQASELRDLRAGLTVSLGPNFPYAAIAGLSREMTERLERSMPATLADAERLRGITPAALAAVLVHAHKVAAAA